MERLIGHSRQFASLAAALSPRTRWAGAATALLIAAGCWLLAGGRPGTDYEPLFTDRSYSEHDVTRMTAAFHAAGLSGARIEGRQIHVPSGQKQDYLVALHAADALPPDFDDALREVVRGENPFLTGKQIESRLRYGELKKLESILAGMDGLESASVQSAEVKQPGFPPTVQRRAFVAVRAIAGNSLDLHKVEAIRDAAAGFIGLERHEVTVCDLNACRSYAGTNAAGSADGAVYANLLAEKALEREYRAKIEQRLSMYPGLVVAVNVDGSHRGTAWSTAARVSAPLVTASIDIPQSYLSRVARERQQYSDVLTPAAALELAEHDLARAIEKAVTMLLPPPPEGLSPIGQVTVTSYPDLAPASEPSPSPNAPSEPLTAAVVTALLAAAGWFAFARSRTRRSAERSNASSSEGPAGTRSPAAESARPGLRESPQLPLPEAARRNPEAAAEPAAQDAPAACPAEEEAVDGGVEINPTLVERLARGEDVAEGDEERGGEAAGPSRAWGANESGEPSGEKAERTAELLQVPTAESAQLPSGFPQPSRCGELLTAAPREPAPDGESPTKPSELPAAAAGLPAALAAGLSAAASRVEPRPGGGYAFENVGLLDDADLSALIRRADPQVTLLALAGASDGFVRRLFQRLPQREARELRRRMLELGPTRLRDIESAQAQLAALAQQLAERGAIAGYRAIPGRDAA